MVAAVFSAKIFPEQLQQSCKQPNGLTCKQGSTCESSSIAQAPRITRLMTTNQRCKKASCPPLAAYAFLAVSAFDLERCEAPQRGRSTVCPYARPRTDHWIAHQSLYTWGSLWFGAFHRYRRGGHIHPTMPSFLSSISRCSGSGWTGLCS